MHRTVTGREEVAEANWAAKSNGRLVSRMFHLATAQFPAFFFKKIIIEYLFSKNFYRIFIYL